MSITITHTNTQKQWQVDQFFTLGFDSLGITGLAPKHCRIEKQGDKVLVRDLRSPLGTKVNGTQVIEAYLNPGDQLELGQESFIIEFASQSKDNTPSLSSKGEALLKKLESKNPFWQSQVMRLPHISSNNFPVLILGPSGTGKEVLADTIHQLSCRRHGPLVKVNCSALSETLIESELFGHVKGSFTGAVADRKGAFESARGGTLFLDEIGDLPYGLQAKLLRALENNEIRPVGSDRVIKTDVRIIAATHKNLLEKIQLGEFRADLYYRLNVIQIHSPALIDRMEDFDTLLFSFCREYRVRFNPKAVEILRKHKWPGNIRELKNMVARAQAFYGNQSVDEAMLLPLLEQNPSAPSPAPAVVVSGSTNLSVIQQIEKEMIIKRLAANRGNQRQTARDLGMPKSTLHDRLKKYEIQVEAMR